MHCNLTKDKSLVCSDIRIKPSSHLFSFAFCHMVGYRGVSRNFLRGGGWNFFVWTENFRGGFETFSSKNPSKSKKFFQKGGRGFDPQKNPWIHPCHNISLPLDIIYEKLLKGWYEYEMNLHHPEYVQFFICSNFLDH
jgi:hypothetical protein